MKWSQLKQQVEGFFSERVRGRVELRLTRYRKAHDGYGRGWITVDGAELLSLCFYRAERAQYREARRLYGEAGQEGREAYARAHEEATALRRQAGIFSCHEFENALYEYLRLSIEEILASENAIVRGIGMLDRRLGKSRLGRLSTAGQPEFARALYRFRCEVEGLATLEPEIAVAAGPGGEHASPEPG